MPNLLFELGVEELPATFVLRAQKDLESAITSRLSAAGVGFGATESYSTPRRLIVGINDVADRQPDSEKEMRGPSLQAAFDAEGNPTKALEGFCRGQGVEVSSVRKDGEYVWATKATVGRPTSEILAEVLPESVKSLTFEKSMRWGSARMRFARPIRWILASFGGAVVPFQIESVASGLESRGHRFNHPAPFEAKTLDELLTQLMMKEVEADATEREKRIREGSTVIASGKPQMTDALVSENVYLTEWPTPLEGEFPAEYLALPEPVLVMAMAKHEKMFPVRDRDGKLTNKFIFIRNGGVDDVVRSGAAWVLTARFNDAKFFFDEDQKHTLDYFLAKTGGIVFQEKLGTVLERAYRLEKLAGFIAEATGADAKEIALASKAALYCKADLSSGLVSELPALQGVIGGEYGRREGFEESVCWALGTHYELDKNPTLTDEASRTAVRVLIADQLDKLSGYLGLGLMPTGSSDPFGLRRAATMLIESALAWPDSFPSFDSLISVAVSGYDKHDFDAEMVKSKLSEIFVGRYESLLEDVRHDILDAAVVSPLDPKSVEFRVGVLKSLADDEKFIQTATRPLNIVSAAKKKGEVINETLDEAAIDSAEGLALLSAVREATSATGDLKSILKALESPINAFFDTTMIMVDDAKVRSARLSLLDLCGKQLLRGGDFSRLVSE